MIINRKNFIGVGKIILGLLLLWLSLRGVQWKQLSGAFLQVSYDLLLLVLLSVLLGLGLKAVRWLMLLGYFGSHMTGITVMEALLAGQAANIILPVRSGEVVRMSLLAAKHPGQGPQILASIAVEKVLDAGALALCGLVVAGYLPTRNLAWIRTWLLPSSIIALIVLVLMALWGSRLYRRLRRSVPIEPPRWMVWLDKQIISLVRSLHLLRSARRILPLLIVTALIWFVMTATNLLLLRSMNLEGGIEASLLVLVLVLIGLLPALMPGNIGPFYFFAQLALTPFAISADQGLAFAILLHALITLPPLLLGGMLLLRSGRLTLLVRDPTLETGFLQPYMYNMLSDSCSHIPDQ